MNRIINLQSELRYIIRKWPIALALGLIGFAISAVLGLMNRTVVTLQPDSRAKIESYLHHAWEQSIVWEEYDTAVIEKVGIMARAKDDVTTVNEEVLNISRWKDAVDSMNSVVYTEYDLLSGSEKAYVDTYHTLLSRSGKELKDMTQEEVDNLLENALNTKVEQFSSAQLAARKGLQGGIMTVILFLIAVAAWYTFSPNVKSAEDIEKLLKKLSLEDQVILMNGLRSLISGKAITDYPLEAENVLVTYAGTTSYSQLEKGIREKTAKEGEKLTIVYVE